MASSMRPDHIANTQSRTGDPVPSHLCADAGRRSHRSFKTVPTEVVARLDRAIQYSREVAMGSRRRGVLDAPLSRGMTVYFILEQRCLDAYSMSYAGLTRVSIHLRKKMDRRVI